MNKSNIQSLTVFRDRNIYGYTVLYKSGRIRTETTGKTLVLPFTLHTFMISAEHSISNQNSVINWYDVTYYN